MATNAKNAGSINKLHCCYCCWWLPFFVAVTVYFSRVILLMFRGLSADGRADDDDRNQPASANNNRDNSKSYCRDEAGRTALKRQQLPLLSYTSTYIHTYIRLHTAERDQRAVGGSNCRIGDSLCSKTRHVCIKCA